jgi:hypothetical protein
VRTGTNWRARSGAGYAVARLSYVTARGTVPVREQGAAGKVVVEVTSVSRMTNDGRLGERAHVHEARATVPDDARHRNVHSGSNKLGSDGRPYSAW